MKTVLGWFAAVAVGLLAMIALSWVLNAAGLASFKFWAPRYEEARRQVTQQSIRRQEGVSEGIGALCMNMRLATDDPSKKAFAHLIVQQGVANNTILDSEAQGCVTDAQRTLGL